MKRHGFTLIELLISISLLVMISGAIFYAFSGTFHNWRQVTRRVEMVEQRAALGQMLLDDVRTAKRIDPASNNSRLVLQTGGVPIIYIFQAGYLIRERENREKVSLAGVLKDPQFSYPAQSLVRIVLSPDYILEAALR